MLTKYKLQDQLNTLDGLKRVSILAVGEFNELQEKYERETAGHKQVLNVAGIIKSERSALARKSMHLMANINPDEKLIKAILEIEKVTQDLEIERAKQKDEIEELKGKQDTQMYLDCIKTLEVKLLHAEEECSQMMEKKTQLAENRIEELTKQVNDLQAQLISARNLAVSSAPPPPPPSPVNAFNALMSIIGFNKTRNAKKFIDKAAEDPVKQAMNEMFSRIKRGDYKLRTVTVQNKLQSRRPSEPIEET